MEGRKRRKGKKQTPQKKTREGGTKRKERAFDYVFLFSCSSPKRAKEGERGRGKKSYPEQNVHPDFAWATVGGEEKEKKEEEGAISLP